MAQLFGYTGFAVINDNFFMVKPGDILMNKLLFSRKYRISFDAKLTMVRGFLERRKPI